MSLIVLNTSCGFHIKVTSRVGYEIHPQVFNTVTVHDNLRHLLCLQAEHVVGFILPQCTLRLLLWLCPWF